MNLKSYRDLFIVITLALTLIAASPVLATVISFQRGSEQFTELWLLSQDHIAGNFPFNVSADEMYTIFVNVANNMHGSEYYLVQIKFQNTTQCIAEELTASKPSSMFPLYEFRFSLADNDYWESPVHFCFKNVTFDEAAALVGNIVINDITFTVDAIAHQDSETNCFFFQLLFELWRYDVISHTFDFCDSFVYLTLDVNTS